MAAGGVASVAAGIFALGRRWTSDVHAFLVVVMVFANVASMALAAGYLAHTARQGLRADAASVAPGPRGYMPHRGPHVPLDLLFARKVLDVADADKDGRLTEDEAAAAAIRFVKAEEAGGNRSIDPNALAAAFHSVLAPHPFHRGVEARPASSGRARGAAGQVAPQPGPPREHGL